jgi:hypothetical protein
MNNSAVTHWMEAFKKAWLAKDIEGVFALLDDSIEYWESPFQMLRKSDPALRTAWNEILPLENMHLDYDIYAADETAGRYTVRWMFSHNERTSAGVYLVTLNTKGLCTYFYRCAISHVDL